ncbi:MAG: diacylglycerol kinase family lipid kinase [Clostridia bacterium]|nr:diacylglycerol kinase family lipid kinase [Clostridia bacterium]
MKALMIINPMSGMRMIQNNAYQFARKLLKNGKLSEVRIVHTGGSGDASRTAAALSPGEYDFVMAVGGDGTINETVNGLMASACGIPLLLLGAGTTNDFVGALGMTGSIAALEKMVDDFCVRDVDVGICNGKYFINVTSVGMLSDIAHTVTPEQKSAMGRMAYYAQGMMELGALKFNTERFRFKTDTEEFEEDVFLMVASNTCQSGGFKKVTPLAKLDDGLLDVCILKTIRQNDILPLFGKIQSGTHINDKSVRYFKTSKLEMDFAGAGGTFAVDCDGEDFGHMPITVSVAPEKLKLLVPRNSARAQKLFSTPL